MVQPSPLRSRSRSPLARLNGNQQQQHDQDQLDLYSDGGRSTRSNTRKIRRTIREEQDNDPYCDYGDDDDDDDDILSSSITSLTPATGSTDADIIIKDHTATMVTTTKKEATTTTTAATAVAVVTGSSRKTRTKKASTRKKTKHKNPDHAEGRWKYWEHIEFLKGLRREGKGKWKAIGRAIPTRSTVQVKTHAQVELKKIDSGIDIFAVLDEYEAQKQQHPQPYESKEGGGKQNRFVVGSNNNDMMEQRGDDDDDDDRFVDKRNHRHHPREQQQQQQPSLLQLRGSEKHNRLDRRLSFSDKRNKENSHRRRHLPSSSPSKRGRLASGESDEFVHPAAGAVGMPSYPSQYTTTTVSTTTVGGPPPALPPHQYHHRRHHHHNHHHHHHPYQYTPSFEAVSSPLRRQYPSSASTPSSSFLPLSQHQPAAFPNAANTHGSFFSSSSNGGSSNGDSTSNNVVNTKTTTAATTTQDVEGAVNLLGLAFSDAYSSSQKKNLVRYNDDVNDKSNMNGNGNGDSSMHMNMNMNYFEV